MDINESVIRRLPSPMSSEIIQYKKQDDKVRLTVGKYLLYQLIADLGYDKELFSRYSIDSNGKPYIPGFLPFNITHSGMVVACAVDKDKGLVGIDVESVRPIEVTKFSKQFSPPEMMQILAAPNPNEKFFEFWTMKEAVMKADGRGMRIPLHSIRLKNGFATIDDSDVIWYYWPLSLHTSVKSHLCCSRKEIKISQLQIEMSALLQTIF